MDAGIITHIVHNLVLVVVYTLLGTIYLPGFVRRLDIPARTKDVFKASLLLFFLLCAWTHFELMIHYNELPEDFFSAAHNIMGIMQAVGAVGFTVVLHPLIFPND